MQTSIKRSNSGYLISDKVEFRAKKWTGTKEDINRDREGQTEYYK